MIDVSKSEIVFLGLDLERSESDSEEDWQGVEKGGACSFNIKVLFYAFISATYIHHHLIGDPILLEDSSMIKLICNYQ